MTTTSLKMVGLLTGLLSSGLVYADKIDPANLCDPSRSDKSICVVTQKVINRSSDSVIYAERVVFAGGTTLRVSKGATFTVIAPSITVEGTGSLKFDGSGEDGTIGDCGDSRGEWSSQGDKDYQDADCKGSNDVGGTGGQGKDGGYGANLIFSTKLKGNIEFSAPGGKGGLGGLGGTGKLLKNGRNNYCDGCMRNCPGGKTGPVGQPGKNGVFTNGS